MTDKKSVTNEIYRVKRPAAPVRWEVDVPGSKSITNRALLVSALGEGPVTLENVLSSDDTGAFIDSLGRLGLAVEDMGKGRLGLEGCAGRFPNREAEIYVGSAGTAARFLTAVLGVSDGKYTILASPQMERRPMGALFDTLLSLGTETEWLGQERHLPVILSGVPRQPRSEPAVVEMDISESTQFLSAFLMAAPLFPDGLRIRITGEKRDGPYVRMTRRIMRDFGVGVRFEKGEYFIPAGTRYHRETYRIEPDVSAACYFYAAAAVTGGYVRVNGIYRDGMQGDLRFLDVLREMGCTVEEEPEGISVSGPEPGGLHGVSVDMRDFSDQALTLAAVAPYADGPVEITDIAHVRRQESDRIHSIVTNLKRAGIDCEESEDGVRIMPGQPGPCLIDTFDDHRVAMAFAVMGLGTDGIEIENPGCCAKTFKDYFKVLDSLTG